MYFTNIFYKNYHSEKQIIVNIGGARSSKSYSILQLLFVYFMNFKNKKFLIVRKTRPSLKMSSWFDFIKILQENNVYNLLDINKSDLTITNLKNNNFMFFRSLDDPEKIKSTDFNYIFMEEANEFTYDDFQILKLRLSAKTKKLKNKMFIALNPVKCWVQEYLLNNPDVEIIHSTYKDNPFLSEDYIKMLEDLKYQNELLYKVYVLGEFAELSNLVYNNYKIINDYDNVSYDEIIYGLDFGFNNPTALVEVKIKDKKNIYIRELLYKTRLTIDETINELKQIIHNKNAMIYADAEDPASIELIYRSGFVGIKPSFKKSVNEGINFIKCLNLHIDNQSSNLIKEIKSYSYKIDKNGNVIDEVVKFNDHLMDAMRYAIYTHMKDRDYVSDAYRILIDKFDNTKG